MESLKEFLGSVKTLESNWEKEFQYLKFLNAMRLHKEFESQYGKCTKLLEEESKDDDYFYRKYLLTHEYSIAITSKNTRIAETGLSESLHWLEVTQYARKLKIIVTMVNQSRIIKSPFDLSSFSSFIEECQKHREIPIIEIYLIGFELFESNSEDVYQTYFKALFTHRAQFSDGEFRDMFTLALNFRNQAFQTNRDSINLEKLFQTYLKGLNDEILLDGMNARERYISSPNLKNVIRLGLMMNRVEWAKQYLKEVESKILPEDRVIMLPYLNSLIAFEEKNYPKCIQLGDEAYQATQDAFFRMDLRIIILKAWYKRSKKKDELIEIVDAYQEALRKYIFRNEITSSLHQERFKNFIRYFVRIWRPNYTNALDVLSVVEDIKEESVMAEKQWLLEEAQQLYDRLI